MYRTTGGTGIGRQPVRGQNIVDPGVSDIGGNKGRTAAATADRIRAQQAGLHTTGAAAEARTARAAAQVAGAAAATGIIPACCASPVVWLLALEQVDQTAQKGGVDLAGNIGAAAAHEVSNCATGFSVCPGEERAFHIIAASGQYAGCTAHRTGCAAVCRAHSRYAQQRRDTVACTTAATAASNENIFGGTVFLSNFGGHGAISVRVIFFKFQRVELVNHGVSTATADFQAAGVTVAAAVTVDAAPFVFHLSLLTVATQLVV